MGDRELKNTIDLLTNYKTLVAEVENIKIAIHEEKNMYMGCTGMSYGENTGKTNKFSSSVENEVINREYRIKKLEDELIKKKNTLNRINNAMETLSDREQYIVKAKYFQKINSWERIGEKAELSGEYCRTLNMDILKKLSRIIFVEKYIYAKNI